MKKNILVLLFFCCFSGACNNASTESNENPTKDPAIAAKAKKLITEQIKTSLGKKASTYGAISFSTLDSCFENLDESADPNKTYPRVFSGFMMTHEFRALDIFDQLHAERRVFYFNAAINKIIKIKDIGTAN